MLLRFAISLVALTVVFSQLLVTPAAAEIAGEWAAYQEDCGKGPGNADTITITRSKISGIEFECRVLKRSKKGGDTVDNVMCTDGVSQSRSTVRYRLDKNRALHVRWITGSSDTYQYQCK
jgi:hypothetical protein